MTDKFSAREAANRYAEDEAFARAFDRVLASLFRRQRKRLERLAARLEMNSGKHSPEVELTPETVLEVIRKKAGKDGTTRGDIAAEFGIDPMDGRLTHIFRVLKNERMIRQYGERRAARYRP
jgi:hypothetical protein